MDCRTCGQFCVDDEDCLRNRLEKSEANLTKANLQISEMKAALSKIIHAAKDSRLDPRLKGHLRVDDIVDADQVLEKFADKRKCALGPEHTEHDAACGGR